jgi:hypothetical protein
VAIAVIGLFAVFVQVQSAAAQNDWLTWGYDQQRTGLRCRIRPISRFSSGIIQLRCCSSFSTTPSRLSTCNE